MSVLKISPNFFNVFIDNFEFQIHQKREACFDSQMISLLPEKQNFT